MLDKIEIKNAKITSTMFGREDHGILTFVIYVDICDGTSCGIGGYALDQRVHGSRIYSAAGLEAMALLMETVGVNCWEELPGKYVRVRTNGWGKPIDAIGNLMDENWLDLRKWFEQFADKT